MLANPSSGRNSLATTTPWSWISAAVEVCFCLRRHRTTRTSITWDWKSTTAKVAAPQKRLKKQQMQNARVIGGDCNIVLTKMIEKHSVSSAHVYFPDPWWKKRHHKRRLFSQQFTEILSDIVQPSGHVHSWSDVAEYFDIIQSLMDGQPDFKTLPAPEERDPEHDMDYQTSFHRKKRKLGLPIYRGLWQRKSLSS